MNIIITIILIILIIGLVIGLLYLSHCKKFILDRFDKGNCIVYGSKGKGKDLVFQYVISKSKKKKNNKINQLSNIDYGYKTQIIKLKDIDIGNNDFNNMINGNITKVDKNKEFEGLNVYLSDSGIYLPCQYDWLLDKEYKSFPIVYATSRHIYNMNIHLNTQALDRPWKKIREQADSYFWVRGNLKLLFGIFIKVRYYELYDSACLKLAPLSARMLNKYSKAETDIYQAQHGQIKNLLLYLPKKNIYYDTRIFETIFFKDIEHKKNKKGHYIRK